MSETPESVSEADIELMEAFVAFMEGTTTTIFAVNESRLEMFARKQKQYGATTLTRCAILEHTKYLHIKVSM